MTCDVVFEKVEKDGKTYNNVFLDFGHGVRIAIRDYNVVEKLRLIKSLTEV